MANSQEQTFRMLFNHKKQYCDIFIHDISNETFKRRGGGRWAYFQATWENPRYGKFGEIHIIKSRLRVDVIVHELDHLRTEWMWANGETVTRRNEEKYATFLDEITRRFIRELRKKEPRIKL